MNKHSYISYDITIHVVLYVKPTFTDKNKLILFIDIEFSRSFISEKHKRQSFILPQIIKVFKQNRPLGLFRIKRESWIISP